MKRIEDERILSGKRTINSRAFGICLLGLWGIILYRQFILQQNIKEYLDIFLLTIGASCYVNIKNIWQGYYITYRKNPTKRRLTLIGGLVGVGVFTLSQVVMMKYDPTKIKDLSEIILQGAIFFTLWVITQSVLLKISEKRGDKDIE